MKNLTEKSSDYLYFLFRIIIGILFLLHGIQKIPGISSGKIQLISLIGFAALIELITGICLILGLFARFVALIAAIEMVVAYYLAHFKPEKIINPLLNNGEPAVLFFAAFLIIIAYGSRKWSIDSLMKK